MPLSLEEMTAVAIRNQHLILAEELKKGVPLNYRDELGRNILEYPDGHIEITQNGKILNIELIYSPEEDIYYI